MIRRIVIDGRMYSESGIGRYIRNLVRELQAIDKDNEYFILHLKEDFQRIEYSRNFHKILADFRWYGTKEQIRLPKLLKGLKPDLVHFPHFNIPIFYQGKFVVTIHDLIHQHFSMKRATTHSSITYKLKKYGYNFVFKTALSKSSKVLVPSGFVKNQLIENWTKDAEKIVVTPEAVDENIFSSVNKVTKGESDKVMEKFDIKTPYIFYVGNAHPHKNVEGLIKAFEVLREKYPDLLLVLSGNDHYFWQRLKRMYKEKGIIYTGYVTDEELVVLYKNAKCFVMPSLEEGFGIPLLESMACFCTVVSSSAGSLQEVGGDACLYFDPLDQSDMVNKISMVLEDEKLRQQLIKEGLKRYKQFSWQRLAKETLEVYGQCA